MNAILEWARRLPPLVWVGVGFNALLVFLPFYDPNDNTFFLSTVGFASGSGPVLGHVTFPGGFFEMALWVPAYFAYVGSGYDLYWSYTILKVVYFVLAILSAWLLYRVGEQWSRATAGRLAVFTLLNPVLLFVSYIWVNWDAFPIFFVLLGYVLLRSEQPRGAVPFRIFLSALAFMVAVFFYWYPLVLFPALLLHGRSTRERGLFLGFSAAAFAALMAVNVLLFTGSYGMYLADLAGTSATFHARPFFGLPFFTGPISLTTYVPILLGVTVVLPVVLRWKGVGEAATLFCVVSLFVWTSPVQEPDNYAWILWFAPLLLLGASRLRLTWSTFLGLSALPIVGALLVAGTTTNGLPDGQGFFYFGYSLFHWNLIWLPTLAGRAEVLAVGNVLLIVALVGTLTAALWGGARGSERRATTESLPPIPIPSPSPSLPRAWPRQAGARSRRTVLVVTVVALILLGGLFNATLPTLVHYNTSGQLPVYVLGPSFVNDPNSPRPLTNETFATEGPNLTIYTPSPPMVFVLRVPYQTLSLQGSLSLTGLVPQSVLLIDSTTFGFSPLTLDTVNAVGSTAVPPAVQTGTMPGTLGFPLMSSTSQDLRVDSGSVLTYNENVSILTGTYQYLSFEFHRDGGTPIPIFELRTPGGTVDFVSHPGYEALLYAPRANPAAVETLTNGFWDISGQWNYVAFRALPSEFWFDFNGVVETFPASWVTSGNGTLTVGQSSLASPAIDPMAGLVTQVRTTLGAPWPVTQYYLNVSGPSAPPGGEYYPVAGSGLTCNWQSTSAGTHIVADGLPFSSPVPTTAIVFGKGTPGNYTVSITLHELAVGPRLADRYYLVPVYLAVVAPFALIAVAFSVLRRT